MELFFLIVLKSKISCSSWLMRKVKNKSLVLWNMIFPRAHPEYPRLLLWNLKLTNNFPNRQQSDQHLISKRLSWVGAGKTSLLELTCRCVPEISKVSREVDFCDHPVVSVCFQSVEKMTVIQKPLSRTFLFHWKVNWNLHCYQAILKWDFVLVYMECNSNFFPTQWKCDVIDRFSHFVVFSEWRFPKKHFFSAYSLMLLFA